MMTYASLFFPSGSLNAAAASAALEAVYSALGYTPFNPFSGSPGKSYPQTVRLFAAPSQGGWTRVLGEVDPALLPPLSEYAPCLYIRMKGEQGDIQAWSKGASVAVESVFELRPAPAPAVAAAPGDPLLDALPDAIKAMNTHPEQAQKLIDRFSDKLLAKAGGADKKAGALQLLSSGETWSSAAGQQIALLCASLGIPNWREPDFATLRDAYQLYARRRRNPNAALLPGDAETMAAVPDALDYLPVYMGKATKG